jgi:iron complex outermembrane receptor protein
VPPYRIAGGPGVDSEKLRAYELGYRLQPAANVELSVAAFYNVYDDLRSLEPLNPPAPFPVALSSGLRGRSTGAEFTAQWQVTSGWQLRAGYTELRVHSEPLPGTVDRGTDRTVAHDPNHQLLLRSSLDLGSHWQLDTTFRYVGSISNQRVPGYGELDVRLGWQPVPAWELAVNGRNLLHNRHSEFNNPGVRREIGRSVYGQVTWRF